MRVYLSFVFLIVDCFRISCFFFGRYVDKLDTVIWLPGLISFLVENTTVGRCRLIF